MAIILRPTHIARLWGPIVDKPPVPPNQRTVDILRQFQREHLARNPAAHEPCEKTEPISAYIGNGAWRIRCRCNEATHADPEWQMAVCFGCGAVYTHVIFPDSWEAIEQVLVQRPVQAHRNWRAPETLESLIEEQIAHGDPV